MDIMPSEHKLPRNLIRTDSIDIPDCFGEYNKKNKLCFKYCTLSIRCCILHSRHPKLDLLDTLLNHNRFAIKMN